MSANKLKEKLLVIGLFNLLSMQLYSANIKYEPSCHQGIIIQHNYYNLCYSISNEISLWGSHLLRKSFVKGEEGRTEDFRKDEKIEESNVDEDSYKRSGFDRGHLVPAADMAKNFHSMSESFYMSNMTPQLPSFNRGIWKKLENQVRNWVLEGRDMIVITGAILPKEPEKVNDLISIPKFFYKIVFDFKNKNEMKMIAFLLPHEKSNKDLAEFAVSVDRIEDMTDLNFFNNLSIEEQVKLESQVEVKDWW
ncbi:DNA/RNA non-specific endonuclease [Bacteriovoracaceae bacterium]|nr:DNA/RNA non-specific endonuclease [Bacteriovoracaceae bacterium]